MVAVGDRAPDFAVPLAGGEAYNDVERFTLSDAIGEGPVVLAFVPAAFTRGCTSELATVRDRYDAFESVGAQVYGVSVDLPFALNIWSMELDLPFPLLADCQHDATAAYDVAREGFYEAVTVAERSVFVIDEAGTITYTWVREPDERPDFDDLVAEVADAAAAAARV